MRKLLKSSALLSALLRLLLAFLPEMQVRLSLKSSKIMRRLTTCDKVSVGFHYLDSDGKEVGNVRYNLCEGYFHVYTWPSSFGALKRTKELIRLLSFAVKIITSENV